MIRVGRREGRFSALALEVRDNDVEILDLNVFFNRGPPQSLRVREFIRAGGRTRPIQFAWGDRSIDRIEITYRARPSFRGRAKVAVFGLQDAGPPPPPPPSARWEELGCGKVGIKPDRDSIRVGRREGRFSAIKLTVRGSKIEIIDLTVVYERGPPDELQRAHEDRRRRRDASARSARRASRHRSRRPDVSGDARIEHDQGSGDGVRARPLSRRKTAKTKSPASLRGSFLLSA